MPPLPPVLTFPSSPPPRTPTPSGGRRATIAAIFRVDPKGEVHLLFIKRAINPRDPWSGNIALPGGKQDAADGDDDEATAVREAREEVRLDLSADGWRRLGRLTEDRTITPRGKAMVVSMFGFVATAASAAPETVLQAAEVASAWWVKTGWLAPERLEWHTMEMVQMRPNLRKQPVATALFRAVGLGTLRYAALPLPPPQPDAAGEFLLWGLTLAFVSDARRASAVAVPLVGTGAGGGFEHPFRAGGGGPLVDAAFRAYFFSKRRWPSRSAVAAAAGALLAVVVVAGLARK